MQCLSKLRRRIRPKTHPAVNGMEARIVDLEATSFREANVTEIQPSGGGNVQLED